MDALWPRKQLEALVEKGCDQRYCRADPGKPPLSYMGSLYGAL